MARKEERQIQQSQKKRAKEPAPFRRYGYYNRTTIGSNPYNPARIIESALEPNPRNNDLRNERTHEFNPCNKEAIASSALACDSALAVDFSKNCSRCVAASLATILIVPGIL